jgi:hypothetical protein
MAEIVNPLNKDFYTFSQQLLGEAVTIIGTSFAFSICQVFYNVSKRFK